MAVSNEIRLPAEATTRSAAAGTMALLLVAGPAIYMAGVAVAWLADGGRLAEVICFDPGRPDHLHALRVVPALCMAIGAAIFLVAAPWLLGMLLFSADDRKRAAAGAWSFVINCLAVIAVFAGVRYSVGAGRWSLLVAWLGWTAVLAALVTRRPGWAERLGDLRRRWGGCAVVGLSAVAAGLIAFAPEQFLQSLNGDGVETYALAHSLNGHLLPYWELEWTGRFGTVVTNPSLLNSYWTAAFQWLLGGSELPARITYWLWSLGIFLVALSMTRRGAEPPRLASTVPIALALFLANLWYAIYAGWNPYMADLANPGVTDAMFILCWLLGLECLRRSDVGGWVVLSVLGSLVLYAGPVMFALTSAAALWWQPIERRRMARGVLAGAAALAAVAASYVVWGWIDGSLAGWWPAIRTEYVAEYVRPGGRLTSAALFAGYFLLACGGVAAAGLLAPFLARRPSDYWDNHPGEADRRRAWERTVATVTLLYLVVVLAGGVKNLHYLGPLMLPPVVLWLRLPERRAVRHVAAVAASLGLMASIWLCWPAARPVFTLNRQLGRLTTFQTDSYEAACGWLAAGDATSELQRRGVLGWYVGRHTWIHYARLKAVAVPQRPLLMADRPPGGAKYRTLFVWGNGVGLYCRDEAVRRWAAHSRPLAAAERFPRVFRPIAVPP